MKEKNWADYIFIGSLWLTIIYNVIWGVPEKVLLGDILAFLLWYMPREYGDK